MLRRDILNEYAKAFLSSDLAMKIALPLLLTLFSLSSSAQGAITAINAFYYAPGFNGSPLSTKIDTGTTPDVAFQVYGTPGPGRPILVGTASNVPGGTANYDLMLIGAHGASIQAGVYFATRETFFADTGIAGFQFSGNGYSSNTSSAFINVLQVEYDPNGKVTKLAVDFTQYEETTYTPNQDFSHYRGGSGSFRFNSDIPLSVPEPATTLFGAIGMAFAMTSKRRRRTLLKI